MEMEHVKNKFMNNEQQLQMKSHDFATIYIA